MARKKKPQKQKTNLSVVAKQKELQDLSVFLRNQEKEYEVHLNAQCKVVCDSIHKIYMDHLKKIPEKLRNMTISEIMDLQQKENTNEEDVDVESLKQYQSHIERNKLASEKKKTNKIARLERKRSISAITCSSSKTGNSGSNTLKRVFSETNLNTPLSKRSVAPAFAVTPKFNPKSVVNKTLLRKPRAGEIVMSLSGSPLRNLTDDIAMKPGLAVSLGCGEVVSITADKEIEKLQHELAKIDENTKKTLQCAKSKLEEILQNY